MKLITVLFFVVLLNERVICFNLLKTISKLGSEKYEIQNYLEKLEGGYQAPFKSHLNGVRNRYLVTFKKGSAIGFLMSSFRIAVSPFDRLFALHHQFDDLNTVSVSMGQLSLNVLRRLKQVESIETEGIMKIVQEATPTCIEQTDSEWCLARVSDASIENTNNYFCKNNAGNNVTVYVIDTGVRINHTEFEGRATHGANFVDEEPDDDLQGHGTACASMVAGRRAGVAKKANIVAVKVLNKDGSGMMSDVIAGILWTRDQKKGIVSMSLGGPFNFITNLAVYLAVNSGQFVAVAAGNEASNACGTSPASTASAFTVAASNYTNTMAWFSNYGSCVDIISPGTKCLLANATTGGFSRASGTSMATPLVAGVAAVKLAENSTLTPAALSTLIIQDSLDGIIQGDLKGTANKFIHSTCPATKKSKFYLF